MLSSWMRMKYPHIIAGAYASSAPILQFPGTTSPYAFYDMVTRTYKLTIENCDSTVKKGLNALNTWSIDSANYQKIQNLFKTCTTPKSQEEVMNLVGQITYAIGSMAMVNYPFAWNLVGSLPANPVATACSAGVQDPTSKDEDQVSGLFKITNTFFNYTEKFECYPIAASTQQESNDITDETAAWNYQTCNDLVIPTQTSGKTDMFLPQPWDPAQIVADC